MVVDIIVLGWVPHAELSLASDVPGSISAHDQISAYDFANYVKGHRGRLGNRSNVKRQKEYVHNLFSNCQHALSLVQTNDTVLGEQALIRQTVKLNPGYTYAAAKLTMDIPAEYCANITNQKWLGVLGGADTFGFENT